MTNWAEMPEWFERRRFVSDRPADSRKPNTWGVRDLATNIVVLNDVTVEEAGLYADALEARYNRYLTEKRSE